MSQNEIIYPETSGQGAQAGISVIPTVNDLLSESENEYLDVARSSDDGGSDSELVFNLFIEGEVPESIGESRDKRGVQVAPTTAEARKAPEPGQSSDGDFLVLASNGMVDFMDKAVTDRLAVLAKKYADLESPYSVLIMQAKTAVKNFFIAEFKKTLARYE